MILREATIKYKGYDPDMLSKGSNKRVCCACDDCGRVRYTLFFSYRDLCFSCSMKRHYLNHPETLKAKSDSMKIYYINHPEAVEKIREESTGRTQTNKSNEKRREKSTGMKHTKESIEKIRSATINQWEDDNFRFQMIGENHPNYNPEVDRFISDNQDKHFCGCGEYIEIMKHHYYVGIPKFIHGHSSVGKNHPNWKGGISFDPYCEKFNPAKKKEVRDKYNNCDYLTGIHRDICNKDRNGKIRELDVHHVDYNKMQGCDDHGWLLVPVSRRHNIMFNKNRPFWERLILYTLEYDKEYYNDRISIGWY